MAEIVVEVVLERMYLNIEGVEYWVDYIQCKSKKKPYKLLKAQTIGRELNTIVTDEDTLSFLSEYLNQLLKTNPYKK